MNILTKLKSLLNKKEKDAKILRGEKMTVVLPAIAKSEDEKADYILQAVAIMEQHIRIIKKTNKNERRKNLR